MVPGISHARTALLIVAAIIVVACGSSSPTAPSADAPPLRRIVVLGDSLAVTPSLAESFPAQLQRAIQREGLRWEVTNAGVGGDTTADGVRRVEPLLAPDVAILIIALGANDGLDGVPIATIEQNLTAIVEAARARGIAVLLCGMETTPLRGWNYLVAFHELFPRTASRLAVPLVPFLLRGVALVPEMNGSDGIHPNAAGARQIADNVWPYLAPLMRAAAAARATGNIPPAA